MLKQGALRSVWRTLEDGVPAVAKRWEPAGTWRGLRARRSARREFELLGRLLALGLPVPRPLALRQRGTAPELVTAFVEGVELGERLRSPAGPELAEHLGRALARAQRLGLRHTDLHAGNVLVDTHGEAWLIDAGGASLGTPLAGAEREEALVMVCADLRERTRRSWRARALRAYHAELGLEDCADQSRRIEARAQERRRTVIAHAQRRWLRDSSSCVRSDGPQGTRLSARTGAGALERIWSLSPRTPSRARALWLAAVRLCDHGLRCARPLEWSQGAPARVDFALPLEARACALEAALAELEPLLGDRGLAIEPSADLCAFRDARGAAILAGAEHIRERGGSAPWK